MAIASPSVQRQPLSEINMTPLVDMLLVMLILTVPIASHSLEYGHAPAWRAERSGMERT